MSAITASLWDPIYPIWHDRSVFVGNATSLECSPDDPWSEPAQVLAYGSAGGTLLFFMMWLLSGLGEAATGGGDSQPLATNHMGTFLLIPPLFVAMGAIIGWRVVDCTLGCSASASSISFFTANIMAEGYVLLFIMLVLIAYIFFERVDVMARNRVAKERDGYKGYPTSSLLGEWLARGGFTMVTITGIMPSLMANCHLQPEGVYEFCWEEEMSNPHGMGVSLGIFLTFLGLQLRAVAPIVGQGIENLRPFGPKAYALYTLALAELTFVLMLFFFGSWMTFMYSGGPNPRTVDVCILHTTLEECTGATLPPLQQRWADQREGGWRCRWDPNVNFYQYPCTKFNCDAGGHLTRNKLSVIFEFLGFLYWAIACAGMTQAIDVIDDIPVHKKFAAKLKARVAAAAAAALV